MQAWIRVTLLSVAVFAIATCGGGSSAGGPGLAPNTYPVPTDPGGNPGNPPGGGGGAPTGGPPGGVVAVFQVGNEQFSLWTPHDTHARRLADAWSGADAPITSICATVVPGSGVGQHNAPYSWSVSTDHSMGFNGPCFACAFAWSTPSQAESGITSGPPYNCSDAHAGATWGMIAMSVVMVGFSDNR